MSDISVQIKRVQAEELVKSSKARFLSYGFDQKFFLILPDKDEVYRNGGEMYYLLPKPNL